MGANFFATQPKRQTNRMESTMTGLEYEQFVRAVLSEKLNLAPEELQSAHVPGAVLPGASSAQHQIDLFYVEETEVARYLTIIECKYRGSRPVDQALIQNLAFVRDNVRAHKAIMVTNKGFTSGAMAIAESQGIALLVVKPKLLEFDYSGADNGDELFAAIHAELSRNPGGSETAVVAKLHGDSRDDARDLVDGLLADPEIRNRAVGLLSDPGINEAARRLVDDNPDLARKASDFFRNKRW